ncbi:MAG: outer membrane beta-barrel protein [Bacteroidales bacterium]|nr:outer membrane beta-barrel protein [Bacteroidales bacterium]
MKRLFAILVIALLAGSVQAQTDTLSATSCTDQPGVRVHLGISASATRFFAASSPYYSRYGFNLHIPLVAEIPLASHWRLVGGLRYDFSWCPLYYNVEFTDGRQDIAFRTTPTAATCHSHLFTNYVGIPVDLEWFPWPNNKNRFSLSLNLFAGYAVVQNLSFKESTPSSGSFAESDMKGKANLSPWKLEVGLNVSTSLIGLIHGVRLFTNLLPTYKDPATGNKIYTSGITMYL